MKKEDLIQKKEEIKNKIYILSEQEKQIEEEYIREHREFKYGEKICVESFLKGEQKQGIVLGAKLDFNLNIQYDVRKIKKNGTPSDHRLTIYYGDVILKNEIS